MTRQSLSAITHNRNCQPLIVLAPDFMHIAAPVPPGTQSSRHSKAAKFRIGFQSATLPDPHGRGPGRFLHNMHRWSQLFIPTLREAPTDAEVASHKLLLRAGYIRQLGAGIYSYLFLGNRSVNKIVAIIREEMDAIGQEMLLPTLHPRELWEASGRWSVMGDNMFRLKDRKGADLCLGMTHEEVMTDIARKELRSYKQLPQIWYQIQTKFRDEPRPKSGLLRVRQFLMKDAYSFDIDEAGLDLSYQKHDAAYRRIFTRCGLQFVAVEADSGAMGGSQSQEFMVYTEAGEDLIASSPSGYAANLEKATSILNPVEDLIPTGDGQPEARPHPRPQDHRRSRSLPQHASRAPDQDHGLHRRAPRDRRQTNQGRRQNPPRRRLPSRRPHRQRGQAGRVSGWRTPPHDPGRARIHLQGPRRLPRPHRSRSRASSQEARNPHPPRQSPRRPRQPDRRSQPGRAPPPQRHPHGRDFKPTLIADVRNILEGELDPIGHQPLRLGKAVEIGHIFKLGYKYTKSMGASVLNKDGKEVTPIMGSYGIGVERILTAAIETSAAANGGDTYALPAAIAPFQVVVTVTNITEPALLAAGEQVAADLTAAGFDVLLDDRDERAGVKFKDADLIGIPYRINIGRGVAEQKIELVDRLRNQTTTLPLTEAATHLTHAMQS